MLSARASFDLKAEDRRTTMQLPPRVAHEDLGSTDKMPTTGEEYFSCSVVSPQVRPAHRPARRLANRRQRNGMIAGSGLRAYEAFATRVDDTDNWPSRFFPWLVVLMRNQWYSADGKLVPDPFLLSSRRRPAAAAQQQEQSPLYVPDPPAPELHIRDKNEMPGHPRTSSQQLPGQQNDSIAPVPSQSQGTAAYDSLFYEMGS
ncbi:uncharacterized protein PG986_009341 [Apiospora aurea]|uniref:Uncharacterized protein n=1 Tax=Apiospora aurea TaxID=335848 RepID=A0ABR1Q7F9_9PEZI